LGFKPKTAWRCGTHLLKFALSVACVEDNAVDAVWMSAVVEARSGV
jgi:hypothetical protein